MSGKRFYHLVRSVLLLTAAWTGAAGATAPVVPRTTADIARLLDRYRPDAQLAARTLMEAEAMPPSSSDSKTLFRFYWMRGLAADKVGRIAQEIVDLRRAAEYGEKGTADNVRMLRNLASAETRGGNLLNGVRAAEAAWGQTAQDQKGQMLAAEQLLAHQYVQLGDFEAARKNLREAEATFILLRRLRRWEELGHNWTALMERARAEVFAADGRQVEAEGAYRKSLRSTELFLEQHGTATAAQQQDTRLVFESMLQFRENMERSLAGSLVNQGKLADAEFYTRRALVHALERVGSASVDAAQGLGLLARVVGEQGRNGEAASLAAEALRCYELAGVVPESLQLANALRALASARVAQGRYGEAVEIFRRMRKGLAKDGELQQKVGSGDLDWVQAMLRSGDPQGAEEMARHMLESSVRKHGDQSPRTQLVRAFHAMSLAALGQKQRARALFAAAMPVLIDQARSDAESDTGTLRRQQRLNAVIESYLSVLSELGAEHAEAAAESFRLADIARGSAVQRALTASAARANLSDPQLASLARREQEAQRRINALSELLTQLLAAPPDQQLPAVQAKMREDIVGLRLEREGLKKDIGAKFPDYAELVDPRPATVAQAMKNLRPGEALLAYYFGEEAGFAWAVRADGKVIFTRVAPNRAELARSVKSLRGALDPGVASIDDIPSFDLALAHRLYTQLVEPLRSVWEGARLLLVAPHAELGQLPLAVLPTAPTPQPGKGGVPFAGYKSVPWLLSQAAIAQLPSVTALASLRRMPPGDPGRLAFAGFGDPLFSQAQAREAGVKIAAASLATRGAFHLRNSPQTARADSAGLALLPRLPDTGEEIGEIAKVLGADPARDVFLRDRATEKAVLETDLDHRRVVMFATHGLVPGDLDGLTEPALALTSPDVVPGAGDGFLTMAKVLPLHLDADWVVLSACNTASGDGAGTEAVSGLGRAFFYAGARALLVSNWPVETVAARLMMTDLFRRQVAEPGLAKAEALRRAMLGLMSGPGALDASTGKPDYSYAHPLFWAPFIVVGD